LSTPSFTPRGEYVLSLVLKNGGANRELHPRITSSPGVCPRGEVKNGPLSSVDKMLLLGAKKINY
jgi:hypothetical protein